MAEGRMKHHREDGDEEIVKQTTLVGLEPPRLKGMGMEDMIRYRRKREEYEALVEEKNKEPGVQIPILSYRNSIETRVLKMMYRAKWITASSLKPSLKNLSRAVLRADPNVQWRI